MNRFMIPKESHEGEHFTFAVKGCYYTIRKGVEYVVREKGEWVERKEIFNESEGEADAIGCSKCGKSQRKYNRTPFCPNCGADLRGALNNEGR